jgi:2-polyprenyl-3-methyl-5-hydroxy-6-metoxy-1,4-benzoquinol methylase
VCAAGSAHKPRMVFREFIPETRINQGIGNKFPIHEISMGEDMKGKEDDLSFPEATPVSVFLDGLEQSLASPFYGRYAASLKLKGHEKVLDFGGGSGSLSRHLARILRKGGGRVTCMDISPGWIEVAKKRLRKYPNVDFIQGDILEMQIEEGSYDAVVIHLMLHHIRRDVQQQTVNALARILKAGGMLFIREPTKESHGTPLDGIRELMTNAGLSEVDSTVYKSMIMGQCYAGVFRK